MEYPRVVSYSATRQIKVN